MLPNSEFIGPGNPIHIGAAKNSAEQAAKEHDVNYTNLIEYAKQHEISQKDFTERVHQFDQSAIDAVYRDWETDRKSTRLNSSHITRSRMPSSA